MVDIQNLREILRYESANDLKTAIVLCKALLERNQLASNLWLLLGRLYQKIEPPGSDEALHALRHAFDLANICDQTSVDALAELYFIENLADDPSSSEKLLVDLIYRIEQLKHFIHESTE